MEFDSIEDPFSSVSQNYSAPVFEESSENLASNTPQIDSEELERQAKRDLENRERQQKLLAKDEKERNEKNLKREQARLELKKWAEDRNKLIFQTKDLNLAKEKKILESRAEFTEKNSWKKVASMIDFKDATDRKELTRMKSVLLAKKHESK